MPATRDPSRPAPSPPAQDLTPEPFPEPSARPELPALPPRATRRELPRPAPPTRALELPPRREAEPARPETDRTEPGTWREIIARFERELGPIKDFEDDADVEAPLEPAEPDAPPQARVPGKWRAPFDIDEAEEPREAEAAGTAETAPSTAAEADQPLTVAGRVDEQQTGAEMVPADDAGADTPLTGTGPPSTATVEPDAASGAEPVRQPEPATGAEPVQPARGPLGESDEPGEPIQPGEPPLLDEPVQWEIGAMTTADYSPPHSIHDAEHDSWPVDTEDGEAVPAWSEDVDETGDIQGADRFGDIGELLLDQVAPADPWDMEPETEKEPQPRSEFPLDAFIVPAGVENVSGYRDADVAQRVAHRLDELARQLRDGGFSSLGTTATVDELSRVLAAVVTGYVARGG